MNTTLTPQQIQIMKDDLAVELTEILMKEKHLTKEDALDVIYTSETFDRLQDSETGFFYQSPGYVYSFLQNELLRAKVS